MINRKIVRSARESLSLSQYDLAEDITTQSTISRMEREGIAPAPEITLKLLERLHLNLNDILINETPDLKMILTQANIATKKSDYESVLALINKIDRDKLVNIDDQRHVDFLKANAMMWTSKDYLQSTFDFKRLIDSVSKDSTNIYRILSICQLGLAYFSNQKREPAEYYFNQLTTLLNHVNIEKNLFWILFIYDNFVEYLLKTKQYKRSIKYGKYALNIAKEYQAYAFVDSISESVGKNYGVTEGWKSKNTQQYFLQSWVFAQIANDKRTIQALTKAFQKHSVRLSPFDGTIETQ